MALVDDVWLNAGREVDSEKSIDWFRRRLLSRPERDPQILSNQCDTDGRRFLQFALVLSVVKEFAFTHWPIQRPRSIKDYITAIRAIGAGGFLEFHSDWIKSSNVDKKSAAAWEHRFLLDLLQLLVQFDQLDPTSLASGELVVRRLVQIELAVKKNPKNPDCTGLESLLESAVDGSCAAVMPELSKWLGENQKQKEILRA